MIEIGACTPDDAVPHLSGVKHELVVDYGRHEAGGRRAGHALGVDFADRQIRL